MDRQITFWPFRSNMLRDEKDEVVKNVEFTKKNLGTLSLHDAVKRGDLNLLKLLINDGRDVNAVNDDGDTPLHLASKICVSTDKFDIISTLLATDTSVLRTNKIGNGAAELLIRDSRVNSSIILSKLFKKLRKECGSSLLTAKKFVEFNCSLAQAVILEDTTVAKYMLDNGCDLNQRFGDRGFTALHWAIINSDIENVKLLLDYGADVNIENHLDHRKPAELLQFQEDKSAEILELLVDRGASLLDDDGNFVNDDFIKYGTKKFINALIRKCKLNLNQKVPWGVTLLYLLVSNKNFDPIDELQDQKLTIETVRYVHEMQNIKTTALIQAAYNGHVRTVEFLLKSGAEVNNTNDGENPALHYAFYKTYRVGSEMRIDLNLKCVEILLEYGADAQRMNRNGNTLFNLVLRSKKFILIKPVLAHLVLIEALGSKLEAIILAQINSHTFFRSYFDSCKRKIGEMKKNVSRSVSLFDILSKSEEKIVDFARNKGLVKKLGSIAYSNRRSKLYYHKILRKRIAKLREIVSMREKALCVLSRIQELRNNRVVLEEIVDYLSYKNLQVLAKV